MENLRKEARMMQDTRIIAYFRQCLPREMNFSSQKEFAETLASIPSNEIPLSNVEVKRNYHQVLTGSIVGLGVSCSALTETSTPWCVGLGIVRAFDYVKGQLFLLTPVPPNALQNVQLIMQSTIEIPACLQQVQHLNA
ncbi:Polynucleotide 5'-hydroxyl-kinase NOL9 [Platanthera guangdongensis]|uniref:Polynucleotide 5'-hydroxyl-kinase NOL9 n=1 Tax=Platanthera guangdongensis TaxID=2320717 RepID=A0ABR2LDL6_9ASPA